MLVVTVQELIATLSGYDPEELLMVTWWSREDVEMLVLDEDVETDKAKDIWEDIVWELDKRTSDHAISSVNDELDTMVYERLEA